MEYLLLSIIVCYIIIKSSAPVNRNRSIDQELARLDRQSEMIQDLDYFKEAYRIQGYDDDLIYNKFNIHYATELGAGNARRMEVQRKIMWEKFKQTDEDYIRLFIDNKNQDHENKA
jgi:hypothetical protein